jgi:phospholipid/cholesterol/gamma-HCH transport system ATP-binding protein
MIRFENVYKAFENNQVLRGVSLEIPTGKTMVIMGPSGTGKSVLLKHIIGIVHPDSGSVYVEDKKISELKTKELDELRKNIGFVFQSAALFDSMSVEGNVSLPLVMHKNMEKSEVKDRVRECLDLVELGDIEKLNPSELSGGMRKRVGIARAIVMNPGYILYDEPTTGLDPKTSNVINDLIIKLQQELSVTSVVVTHDVESAYKVSHKIAMLFEGKIVASGTKEQIENNENEILAKFIRGEMT